VYCPDSSTALNNFVHINEIERHLLQVGVQLIFYPYYSKNGMVDCHNRFIRTNNLRNVIETIHGSPDHIGQNEGVSFLSWFLINFLSNTLQIAFGRPFNLVLFISEKKLESSQHLPVQTDCTQVQKESYLKR